MPNPVSVSSSGPGFIQLARDLQRLKRSEVVIGIPAEKAPRKDGPINNAALLFIHSKGSPLQNIPARPILEPAIEQNRDTITPHLGNAARQIINGQPQEAERSLKRAGVVASNSAKRYFVEGILAPLALSTIARKGSNRPLIDTGQMRRAITYVIRSYR